LNATYPIGLLWNPEPLGSFFGDVCMQAWRQNPDDFGREVMNILEKRLGCAPLEEALSAPVNTAERSPALVATP